MPIGSSDSSGRKKLTGLSQNRQIIHVGKKSEWGRHWIFILAWWPFFLYAQNALDTTVLNKINTRIEFHLDGGSRDSLMYYYQRKIDLFRQADDLDGWVNAYLDLGLSEPNRTLSFLDTMNAHMWRIPRDSTEKEALLWCYMYQGYYLKEANDVWGSARAYERALEWYADFSPEGFDILEWVMKPLGNQYTRLGDNEKAIHFFSEAIEFTKGKYPSNSLAGLYNNLGLAYWNQAEFDSAIEQYQRGLALKDLFPQNRALLLSNLAGSYFDNGNLEKASAAATQADQLFKSLNSKAMQDRQILAWVSGNKKILGRISLEKEQYEAAGLFFREALAKSIKAFPGPVNRQVGKIHIETGKLKQLEGKWSEALSSYNQALQSVIPVFQPKTLLENPEPADLYEENTIFEALEGKADVLLNIFYGDPNPEYLRAALECHQLASQVESLLRQTYQYQSSKLRLQEHSRRRSEQAIEVAHLLYLKTQDPAYAIHAFNFAEQNKATILLEAVKKNLALQKINSRDSLFSAEQQLKNLQAELSRKLLEAELTGIPADAVKRLKEQRRTISFRLLNCTRQIEQAYPSLKSMKAQLAPVDFAELQARLQSEECELIEYFEGNQAIYRFRISGKAVPQMTRILLQDSVRAALDAFRGYFVSSKVIANDPGGFLSKAYEVYQLLLGTSFEGRQDQAKKRIVIPDGQLHLIPFEALLTAVPTGAGLARAPYLIKDRPLYYAYSATLWYIQQDRQATAYSVRSLLAIAPVFDKGGQSLPVLEHSHRSSRKLVAGFQNSQLLVREEARLENFRKLASKYPILHLATHASSNDQQVSPNIAFFDSTLYLPEIYALRLSAELVVLSACETGVGEIRAGEGIMSLARSFFYAGADGLVSSLWKTNDYTTSHLFSAFYDKLAKKESIALALQHAKLEYLKDPEIGDAQKSPYYWAGFVFVGNDKELNLKATHMFPVWLLLGLGILILAAIVYRRKVLGELK